jgi:hypothetical protein
MVKHIQKTWLEVAKSLQQGRKIRMTCCGADNSLLVNHSEKGYSCHCFRCGNNEWHGHGLRSIDTIQRHKREREACMYKQVQLPDDYTLTIPDKLAVWFYQYGISAPLARSYGIGYSPSLDRVVLPVFESGTLTAVQMRTIDPARKPKYLNPTGPGVSGAIFESDLRPTKGVTVLVEDILSAIKVGKVHHATSILGTNMTDVRAAKINSKNHTVLIWLDSDKAGREGARDAEKQLLLLGVRVIRICTPLDPKLYTLEEIRRHIQYD